MSSSEEQSLDSHRFIEKKLAESDIKKVQEIDLRRLSKIYLTIDKESVK